MRKALAPYLLSMGRGKRCKAQATNGIQGQPDLCGQCLSPLTDDEVTDPDTGATLCLDCHEDNVREKTRQSFPYQKVEQAISKLMCAWEDFQSLDIAPTVARILIEDNVSSTGYTTYADQLIGDAIDKVLSDAECAEDEDD